MRHSQNVQRWSFTKSRAKERKMNTRRRLEEEQGGTIGHQKTPFYKTMFRWNRGILPFGYLAVLL